MLSIVANARWIEGDRLESCVIESIERGGIEDCRWLEDCIYENIERQLRIGR